ncbi:acyl-CoA thioesterase [Streptomyces sp. SP18CS02]|uniref:acyl-CoA thioesterase n=1 Tax=Streptomyces sp. SP18CS02 TaxID=3002531 RepID=UPI002E79C36E|nr:acyl-CoA thioesterase domain-containing protein [Streptomyces sp. SP18CS02]MEE1754770.1 thioesterase family protein [Streptomyces sp. SP18CS02]
MTTETDTGTGHGTGSGTGTGAAEGSRSEGGVTAAAAAAGGAGTTAAAVGTGAGVLAALLALTETGEDRFRADVVVREPFPLYGGQVAAQALLATGLTVSADRIPHSLHASYLAAGDTSRAVDFRVERDRDGHFFSSRRVTAEQDGKAFFTMTASFHRPARGRDAQLEPAPKATPPDDSAPFDMARLPWIEWRLPRQAQPWGRGLPTRVWARPREGVTGTPLLQACALAYVSDVSTGVSGVEGGGRGAGITLDHSLWFHRPARFDSWMLLDMVPRTVAHGRGWYSGGIYSADGVLVASLAQETLFPPVRKPKSRPEAAAGS